MTSESRPKLLRIAVGGIGHETNSFAEGVTPLEKFLRGGEFPAAMTGDVLVSTLSKLNFGASGFIRSMRDEAELIPLAWGQGGAGAPVADEAFEWFATRIVDALKAAGPTTLDAVYLDLHGSMMTESLDDAEGELLRRVREVVGPTKPVVASMDYHGNLTAQMMNALDALSAYRTYPHIDRHDAGARVAGMLREVLVRGQPTYKKIKRGPFLIPLPFENTDRHPSGTLVSLVEPRPEGVLSFEYVPGFPASDFPEAGPSAFAVGYDEAAVDKAVDGLHARLVGLESDFAEPILSPTDALARVAELRVEGIQGPIILADTQDNPGGGGTSDTTGLLEAMIEAKVENAALAMMHDPEAALAAHKAGVGAHVTLDLGGRNGPDGVRPYSGTFLVKAISDGNFVTTGRTIGGRSIRLGPTAVLTIGGVDVIVGSTRMQPYDLMIFQHLGVEPEDYAILGLKSTVHFRADYAPLAKAIILVKAPGLHLADLTEYPFRKLRDGVRLGPLSTTYHAPGQ